MFFSLHNQLEIKTEHAHGRIEDGQPYVLEDESKLKRSQVELAFATENSRHPQVK